MLISTLCPRHLPVSAAASYANEMLRTWGLNRSPKKKPFDTVLLHLLC